MSRKNLAILTDSERSAMLFGKIKADLKSKGKIIEDLDILIASIAIADNCILVTNNTDHFERVGGLHSSLRARRNSPNPDSNSKLVKKVGGIADRRTEASATLRYFGLLCFS